MVTISHAGILVWDSRSISATNYLMDVRTISRVDIGFYRGYYQSPYMRSISLGLTKNVGRSSNGG